MSNPSTRLTGVSKPALFILVALLSLPGLLQAANLKPYTGNAPTPPLVLTDLQGKSHDLNDYKGQVVLVQFWATYCGPCRKEMPSMNKMKGKMGEVPFSILAVDMGETEAEVKQFVERSQTRVHHPDG